MPLRSPLVSAKLRNITHMVVTGNRLQLRARGQKHSLRLNVLLEKSEVASTVYGFLWLI
jgi:hypothetical protein